MDLALGWHVDDRVAHEVGEAAQASLRRHAAATPVVCFDATGRREVIGRRGDAVLGELADPLLDLAPPAQPMPAADRIDVDAQ